MNKIDVIPTEQQLKEEKYVCTAQPFELGTVVMTRGVDHLLRTNLGANLGHDSNQLIQR